MEVRATSPDAYEDIQPENDDHDANGELQHSFRARRNRFAEQEECAANRQQRDRVSDAPDAASQYKGTTGTAALGQRSDGGEVIRLKGVLHADETAKH